MLVIAADQTIPLVKELAAKGIDTHKLYMPDSNMVDHSKDFTSGLLKGSKGTIPGAHPTSEFQNALKTIAPDTTIYTYNTETYDAMVLAALAAEKGGAADSETVQKNLMAVSGTTKGEKCESYEDCVALMKSGKEIQYVGKTSIGVFNTPTTRAPHRLASMSMTTAMCRSSWIHRRAQCRRISSRRARQADRACAYAEICGLFYGTFRTTDHKLLPTRSISRTLPHSRPQNRSFTACFTESSEKGAKKAPACGRVFGSVRAPDRGGVCKRHGLRKTHAICRASAKQRRKSTWLNFTANSQDALY